MCCIYASSLNQITCRWSERLLSKLVFVSGNFPYSRFSSEVPGNGVFKTRPVRNNSRANYPRTTTIVLLGDLNCVYTSMLSRSGSHPCDASLSLNDRSLVNHSSSFIIPICRVPNYLGNNRLLSLSSFWVCHVGKFRAFQRDLIISTPRSSRNGDTFTY